MALDQFELIALDTLMGDPLAWPASIWGATFAKPAGDLPASYRRFGAVEMGMAWLDDRGYTVERRDVRRHYRFDVPKIAVTPEELVATGLIVRGNKVMDPATLDPLAYLTYYNEGIAAGTKGLQLIRARIAALEAANELALNDGKPAVEIPLALLKMAVDVGSKLAMSQAAIRAAGRPWGDEGDADEGFRAGSAPAASPRMGHHRIRTIDGEARPVVDEGPADRAAYNERARQEGSPELPSP